MNDKTREQKLEQAWVKEDTAELLLFHAARCLADADLTLTTLDQDPEVGPFEACDDLRSAARSYANAYYRRRRFDV